MKQRILRYLKHIFGTLFIVVLVGIAIIVSLHGTLHYGDDPLRYDLENEGPYVFYKNDSIIEVNYIKGNKEDGFYVQQKEYDAGNEFLLNSYFTLEGSHFNFTLKNEFKIPETIYNDREPILALSDIESGYQTFRDFLIQNKVIDASLHWTFKKGHLVLLGDFVDRGCSTKQVLWFMYKLEQEAEAQGGKVHFILGNHELKNMEGKYEAASQKYEAVAAILGKQHHNLYDQNSFIGKWMSSKNTIEYINGTLFTHGGLHPEITDSNITLHDLNQINRANYYHSYYPKPEKNVAQLAISSKKGICWYRGYFKDAITQEEVEKGLRKFDAKAIVVGHTLQHKVKKYYKGKVYAIDVKHPKDYRKDWPFVSSEGLFIENDTYYRVLDDGTKKEL